MDRNGAVRLGSPAPYGCVVFVGCGLGRTAPSLLKNVLSLVMDRNGAVRRGSPAPYDYRFVGCGEGRTALGVLKDVLRVVIDRNGVVRRGPPTDIACLRLHVVRHNSTLN